MLSNDLKKKDYIKICFRICKRVEKVTRKQREIESKRKSERARKNKENRSQKMLGLD